MANQRDLIREGGLAVVGRYMDGNKVVGYHLSSDKGGGGRVTKEQLHALIQKKAVTNCTSQIYKGEILVRATGDVKINDMPVYNERTGEYKSADGNCAGAKIGKYLAVKRIMAGPKMVFVELMDAAHNVRCVDRNSFIELVKNGSIANVKAHKNNDSIVLRYADGQHAEMVQIDNTKYFNSWSKTPDGQKYVAYKGSPKTLENALKCIESGEVDVLNPAKINGRAMEIFKDILELSLYAQVHPKEGAQFIKQYGESVRDCRLQMKAIGNILMTCFGNEATVNEKRQKRA